MEDDTIAAISTPPGTGALGTVRLSGPGTLSVLSGLCPAQKVWQDRHATLAIARSPAGERIDEAVVTFFRGPHSYSGEDMAEISCHGNPLILQRVVSAALGLGARAARPGEFTLRAYLSGRIDLTQAEAVVDLVESKTEAGLGLALSQIDGELTCRVEPLRSRLLDLLAHATALVDFSEDDIPHLATEEMAKQLGEVMAHIDDLLAGAQQGQVLRYGVSLTIAGPPNVGKSSILNGLLGRSRAIVTPIAGTTRDTLEEELSLDGILFRVTDTAGLTKTNDPVEAMGIDRSHSAMGASDIVLVVIDRSVSLRDEQLVALKAALAAVSGASVAIALNKSDLAAVQTREALMDLHPGARMVETSTVTHNGLDGLRRLLPDLASAGPWTDGFVVSNQRHVQALEAASEDLKRALSAQAEGLPLDIYSMDIRAAAESLGEILGIGIGDEILERVFSRFCIGK